jgi:putative transposase
MPPDKPHHRRNYNDPGNAHELTFCCYRGYKFLVSDRVRVWFREALDVARAELEFDLWAYVFMPEHIHLVICPRLPTYDIGEIRQAIKEPVGRVAMKYLREHRPDWLPKVTRRRGKRNERLFWRSGGGYYRNVKEPSTLMPMIEYIHLNPVRRSLVERAVDWEWSSAAELEDVGESPVRLDPIPSDWLDCGS